MYHIQPNRKRKVGARGRKSGADTYVLAEICDAQHRPVLLVACVQELERRALGVEGLYRLSGCASASAAAISIAITSAAIAPMFLGISLTLA